MSIFALPQERILRHSFEVYVGLSQSTAIHLGQSRILDTKQSKLNIWRTMKKGGKHLSTLSGNKMTAIRSGRNKANAKTSDRQVFSVQRICAASDCGREFTAYNNTTLYCCPACYQREYYKRHKKKIAKQRAVRNAKQMLSLPVPAPMIKHSLPDDRPTPK